MDEGNNKPADVEIEKPGNTDRPPVDQDLVNYFQKELNPGESEKRDK